MAEPSAPDPARPSRSRPARGGAEDARLLASARTLLVDGWTAEALEAMSRAGVSALLLKGPAIARWLYDSDEHRDYGDADLLVSPATVRAAEVVLERLGYELKDPEGELALRSGPHAQTWVRRRDAAVVDLHHTLPGDVSAEAVAWSTLRKHTTTLGLAGGEVAVLDEPARAVLVALHAAHHGYANPQAIEDLRRAAVRLSDAVWARAAMLAEEMVALPRFAEGLRLVPEGARVADSIELPPGEVLLALASASPLATGFERLGATRRRRDRVALLRRKAFPPVEFIEWWRPWARGSRWRLAVGYLYRLAYLAAHAGPGWWAWRRSRRAAR